MEPTVIILGAPRSGTNMLRDALTSLDGFGTWPCDEINYIWRHGNIRYPTDELPPELATSAVARYIQSRFLSMRNSIGGRILVEKTCANCLRVPFVHRIFPDAKYVYIHRDGIDAVGSSLLRWHAGLDLSYIAAKARFVPVSDIPYYGVRYLGNRLRRTVSKDGRLASWGPVIPGMKGLLQERSLLEVCALQWQRCVDLAELGMAGIDAGQVARVSYEEFVSAPEAGLNRLAKFLGVDASEGQVRSAVSKVSKNSLGKGRAALEEDDRSSLEALIAPSLARYGYV